MTNEQGVSGATTRATGHSGNTPGQGPFMEIHLHILQGIIQKASYETYHARRPCLWKGHLRLVTGRTIEYGGAITHSTFAERVGPLPRHRQLCYGLALLALDDALSKWDRTDSCDNLSPAAGSTDDDCQWKE